MAELQTMAPLRQMSLADLDGYKDLIHRWYIRDRMSVKGIIQELHTSYNFTIAQWKLKEKIEAWGMRKNLSRAEQTFVAYQEARTKPSINRIEYQLSGQSIPRRRIQRIRERPIPSVGLQPLCSGPTYGNHLITMGPVSSLPSTDLTVHETLSLEVGVWEPWPNEPHELPWIQFSRNSQLLDSIASLLFTRSSNQSSGPLAIGCRIPQYFSSGESGVTYPNVQILARKFATYMPESEQGENSRRAMAVTKSWPELNMEVLKLIIFHLANNFVHSREDYENTIELVDRLGLGNRAAIQALFRVASNDLIVAAVLDKLFIAAYRTAAAELVSILIEENEATTHGSSRAVLDLPLHSALLESIYRPDSELARAIITPNTVSVVNCLRKHGQELLSQCSRMGAHDFACCFSRLLLSRGVKPEDSKDQLLSALRAGNITLALAWIEAGVNTQITSYRSLDPFLEGRKMVCETIWTAAVSPFIRFTTQEASGARETKDDTSSVYGGGEDLQQAERCVLQAWELLEERLSVARFHGLPPTIDMLIKAAYYGYACLIEMVTKDANNLNQVNNSGLSPLLVAVFRKHTNACARLLQLGADPNFVPPFDGVHMIPSALHVASAANFQPGLHLLISSGANVDQACDLRALVGYKYGYSQFYCLWCHEKLHENDMWGLHCNDCTHPNNRAVTPLHLAIRESHEEAVRILLQGGARVEQTELSIAIEHGNERIAGAILANLHKRQLLGSQVRGQPHIQLAKAEYLPLAVRVKSLEMVLRIVPVLNVQRDQHHFAKALRYAFQDGSADIVDALVRGVPQLSQGWLFDSFRFCEKDRLGNIVKGVRDLRDVAQNRSPERRPLLEAAMLNQHPGVSKLALGILPQTYDSGALVAFLCRSFNSTDFSLQSKTFTNLLERRRVAPKEHLNPVLENTAIALAAHTGRLDLLKMLLERAQPGALAIIPGHTYWACNNSLSDRVWPGELGIESAYSNILLREKSLTGWAGWHEADPWMASPIFMAIKGGSQETIQELLSRDYRPDNPSFTAAAFTGLHIVRQLIPFRSLNAAQSDEATEFYTPLYAAVATRNLEIVQALAKPEKVDNRYFSYDATCFRWDKDRVNDFIGNIGNFTALQLAIIMGNSDDIAYHLIHSGADVNAPAHEDGMTALQAAAARGKIDLARYLLMQGANLNAPRAISGGLTCLEAAAYYGRLEMVQFLLNQGVKTSGTGRVQYLRAISLATSSGHAAVSKLLSRHRPLDIEDKLLLVYDPWEWDLTDSTSSFDGGHLSTDQDADIEGFIHPDEASVEDRKAARQWRPYQDYQPPLDAELDLLSDDELTLSSLDRDWLLATILARPEEAKRRFELSRPDYRGNIDFHRCSAFFLVPSSALLIYYSMRKDESTDSSDTESLDNQPNQFAAINPSVDEELAMPIDSYHDPEFWEWIERSEEAEITLPLHPAFDTHREVVDFHENISLDTDV